MTEIQGCLKTRRTGEVRLVIPTWNQCDNMPAAPFDQKFGGVESRLVFIIDNIWDSGIILCYLVKGYDWKRIVFQASGYFCQVADGDHAIYIFGDKVKDIIGFNFRFPFCIADKKRVSLVMEKCLTIVYNSGKEFICDKRRSM